MTTIRKCPQCGAEMMMDAPEGLCPACLLRGGLASATGSVNAGTISAGAAPPVAARRQPLPGQMFGNYRIQRKLGGGGMGEVFEAEQLETGRRLAIKVLSQAIGSEVDRKRFIREGRLAATVSDPHVVYVFGSEEIEGAPVIAMELVPGGTLSERVKKGRPLPPAEAVDVILQVIDGLEAAHAAGVLHRDIKPANCFVDRDGTVKIGDFGLSISTLGHLESQSITAPGSLLGTPAFASPEQLGGAVLDVRADVYSVGATLYFLLTGKAPLEANTIVELIAAVLSRAPVSPKTLQPGIPRSLANVVLRCLAKEPKARFANYAQLRQALAPFRSTAPTPGTLGLRFVAGMIDTFVAGLPAGVLAGVFMMIAGHEMLRGYHAFMHAACVLLYYAILEGLWGASLGKVICGLRVIGPDRQAPGVPRALLRAAVFYLLDCVPISLLEHWKIACLFFWALLFVTMRRRNGFAGLHELLTGTRVVAKPAPQARPALPRAEPAAVPAPAARRVGPYAVLDTLAPASDGELLLGYDDVLRRQVWIVTHSGPTPPLPPARRDLARPGRVRWLNGRRAAQENWDAYEAPGGLPLLELCGLGVAAKCVVAESQLTPKLMGRMRMLRRQPSDWAAVRFWLLDLAEEIRAGLKDGSLPPLTLANVWISTRGRALLLDLGTAPPTAPPALPDIQKFLSDVAAAALGPEPHGLPLQVGPFLSDLGTRSFNAMEFIVAILKSFTEKLPAVSRGRRAASLFLAPACFAAIAILVCLGMFMQQRVHDKLPGLHDPQITEFRQMLAVYADPLSETNRKVVQGTHLSEANRKAFQDLVAAEHEGLIENQKKLDDMEVGNGVKIAARYGTLINDPKFWETYGETMKRASPKARRLAEEAVAKYSHPTAEQEKLSDSTPASVLIDPQQKEGTVSPEMAIQKRALDELPGAHDPKITEFRQMLAMYAIVASETNRKIMQGMQSAQLYNLINDPKNVEIGQGVKIAARYGALINDPKFWETYGEIMKRASPDARRLAGQAVAKYSHPTAEQQKLSDVLPAFLPSDPAEMKGIGIRESILVGVLFLLGFIATMAAFNFIFCVVGIPVGLRLFGIAIVDKDGQPASRWVLLRRWFVIWLFPGVLWIFGGPPVAAAMARPFGIDWLIGASPLLICGIPWLIGVALALRNPSRGVHDSMAGTWLVPR